MKINNPRLFNGQLLASYQQIADYLSGTFAYTEGTGFSGLIDTSFIPISGIAATSGYYNIFADTIKMSSADSQTISEKFTDIQGKIDAVKQYKVEAANGLTVTSGSATTDGITTDTFTVSIDANAYKLVQLTDEASEYASSYALQGPDGNTVGATINIPKDQFLSGAVYVPSAEVLRLTFKLNVEGGTTNIVDIPVGDLVDEYSAGAGIDITNVVDGTNVIKVKIDETASEDFLSVDAAGLKVTGVKAAIDAASGFAYAEAIATASGYTDEQINSLRNETASVYSQIVNVTEITSDDISEYTVDTLLVTNDGETAIVLAGANPEDNQLIQISKEVVTNSEDLADAANAELVATANAVKEYVSGQFVAKTADEITDTLSALLPTVAAVKTYVDSIDINKFVEVTQTDYNNAVSGMIPTGWVEDRIYYTSGGCAAVYEVEGETGKVTELANKIKADQALEDVKTTVTDTITAVQNTVTDTRGRAVEFFEVNKAIGTVEVDGVTSSVPCEVTGRVIAVYDAAGDQCYPSITYNKETGVSQLIIDYPSALYDIVYSAVISAYVAPTE